MKAEGRLTFALVVAKRPFEADEKNIISFEMHYVGFFLRLYLKKILSIVL